MKKRNTAELLLMLLVLVWSLNFSVIKYSLEEIDPHSFNAIRFALAILFMWGAVWYRKLNVRIRRRDLGKVFLLGMLGTLLYQLLFIIGINRTNASNAAVMLGLIPVWIAIFSHFFSDEKMYRLQVIGVILAFTGVLLIMAGGEQGLSFQSESLIGDLIVVISAMVFGAYTIMSRSMLGSYSPLTLATAVVTTGGFLLIILAVPDLMALDFQSVSPAAWGGVAFSGIFAIGLAFLVWNLNLKNIGAIRTGTYQNMVPVLGVFFGVIFLGEKLHYLQYIGALSTIGGIILTRSAGIRRT